MTKTLQAVWDGKVLRLSEPIGLKPNTKVWVTIETEDEDGKSTSFLKTAQSLNLQGPRDWSARFKEFATGYF